LQPTANIKNIKSSVDILLILKWSAITQALYAHMNNKTIFKKSCQLDIILKMLIVFLYMPQKQINIFIKETKIRYYKSQGKTHTFTDI
jgi:hypothetical protein